MHIQAIHTTLFRVLCIEYTWLFVNAQFYAVLCISYSKCIFFFFWHLNNLIARKTNITFEKHMKTYTHFFHSHNLIAIQLLKKCVYKCIEFLRINYQQQQTIHTIQRFVCIDQLFCYVCYNQTSVQRQHAKNVSVFVRSMCITQRKIVCNYCFKQGSNKYC